MDEGIETTRTTVVDGVRVRKTIEAEADETAVVTLAVTAERDEPTTVRVVEPALGSVPTDAVELTADDAAEHWRLDDDPTFEREFDPGESYDVVYRVSGVDPDRFDALDVDPVVAPAGAAADDLVDRDDSDAVRELIAGERDSLATAPAAGGVELATEEAPVESSQGVEDEPADGPVDAPTATAEPADESGAEPPGGPVEIEADADSERVEIEADADSERVEIEADADSEPVDVDGDAADVELDESGEEPATADAGTLSEEGALVEEPGPDEDGGPDEDSGPGEFGFEEETADEDGASAGSTADEGTAPVHADGAEEPRSGDIDASLAATPSGGVARALLSELREGNVDEETRAALREELEPGRSQDVRIKHLQSEVAEFSAYVELLDEFVDEYGTFESVFGELTSLDEEVESVRADLDEVREAVEDVDEVSAEVADLRAEKAALEERLDELAAGLEAVDESLEEFDQFRDRISDAFRGTGDAES